MTTLRYPSLCAGLLALACAAVGAAASDPPAPPAAPGTQAQYNRDRAACAQIKAGDAHENCLSEASTRFAGAQPPVVDPDPGRLARNALLRCNPLPDAQRTDCIARMEGQGTTTGSAADGGIYRELITREPSAASAPAPAASR